MRKEVFNELKKELLYLLIALISLFAVLKIAFYNEGVFAVARNAVSIFWLFALPGYFLMLYWKESLSFMERFAAGIALSAGVIGISSYYLGIAGLNIKHHVILLPLAVMAIGFIAASKKK